MKPNKTPRKHAAFASSSRQMKRRTKVKSLLAVLVAFCTVCTLTMPAATLEGQAQASCGLAEHTHDESCYESVLVCGQEESEGHVHDESCYEEVLTCEIPEHTHSEACWAQPEAQAETGEETGAEAGSESGAAVTEDKTGGEAGEDSTGAGTGTENGAGGNTGTEAGTESSSETGSTGTENENQGTPSGETDKTETDVTEADDGTGTGAEDKAESGSGTEEAGGQEQEISDEDALKDEAEEAQKAQAAEKAAAAPDGSEVPEGYTERYTVRDDENGFAVTVYAPENVIPDGAVLSARLLDEGEEAYTEAEQELAEETEKALAENGIDLQSENGTKTASEDGEAAGPSYGFAALDIHFEDAEGNEVEPDGQVYVVIDAAGLIPEDADPESVTVQHHAEKEDGSVAVETVADTAEETEGIVAVVENTEEAEAKADVQAAFEVDGFSKFTITWSGKGKNYFQVTVHYVDENGEEITGKQSGNINISDSYYNNTVTFSDYAGSIEGYIYSGAYYNNYPGGREVTKMEASDESGRIGTHYKLTFYNGNKEIVSLNYYSVGDIGSDTQKADIYLVYTEENGGGDNPGGGEITENASVTTGKTVIAKDENYNYDLTLSITGDRGSSSKKQNVDVLFILDESGSMDYKLDRDSDAGRNESSRMDLLQSSVKNLVDTVAENTSIDARFAAVSFARSQQRDRVNWTTASGVKTFVNNLSPDGGTNYQQGIYDGKELLESARSDALTFVIFVSDGEPTYRGINVSNYAGDRDWYASDHGNGQDDNNGYNIVAAVSEIGNMNCNYFYAIGMGPDFGQEYDRWDQEWVDKEGTKNLKKLANAVNAQFMGDDNVFSANDTETLEDAFDDIAGSITFFAADHVVMTDPLSKWVDIVPDTDGKVRFEVKLEKQNATGQYEQVGNTQVVDSGENAYFTTWAENEEGKEISTEFSITPVWTPNPEGSETPGIITVKFDDDYELAPGYRYSVTTTITPNESARAEGPDGYDGTGENNTGTHSGARGFWSNVNDQAKVSYQVTGVPGDEPFPKPVVQVPEEVTGDLVITKEVAGATVDGKEYTFIISTSNEDVAGKGYVTDTNETVTFSNTPEAGFYKAAVKVSASSNTDTVDGSVTVTDLPEGVYTVEEQEPDELAGYLFNGTSYRVNGAESNRVTVEPDITAQIDVTNAYVPLTDITIKKVDSSNKDITLKNAGFILYYKTETDEEHYYSISGSEVFWITNKDEATELSSNEEGTVKFMELRKDITYYLVETKAPDGYNLLEHEVKISWNSEGELQASYGTTPIEDIDQTERIITVTNSTGTELPETGGPGTTILTIGGLLLMAGAVGGGYGLRRRRGKEGR